MLFSIYGGPEQMKNMIANESTSIHFRSQIPIHQEPVTSLISHRGQARSNVPPEPLNDKHWSASLRTGIFFCHIMNGNGNGSVLSLVFFGIQNCAPAGSSLQASKSACNLDEKS